METSDTPAMESGASDPVQGFEALLDKQFGVEPPKQEAEKPQEVDTSLDVDNPEEEPEEVKEPEAKTYKVKVDGQEIEVPEAELLKGYSRQQDYTRKTMELAAERQQIQAQAQQVQAERQQYMEQLGRMQQALGQQLQQQNQIDWNELIEKDPVEYLKQQHLFQQRQAAYQEAERVRAQQAQIQQQQLIQQRQQVLATEAELLMSHLPEWKDEAKAKAEKAALAKHLIERGYSEADVAQLADHKAVLLARDAMLYRQMVAKAKETVKTVEKLPPRMEKPGVQRSPTDGRTALMQNLKKSGSTDAAAALFERLL
jgi:multidrug efflux pump subunit AcrA (membrane-fusion protein)